MKKRFISLVALFVIMSIPVLLFSCSSLSDRDTESATDTATQTETEHSTETETEAEPEQPPKPEFTSAWQVIAAYLPEFDTSEDENWEQKMNSNPYHIPGVNFKFEYGRNDKYIAAIEIAPPPDAAIDTMMEALRSVDPSMTREDCVRLCQWAYSVEFMEHYLTPAGKYLFDICWKQDVGAFGVFGTREELETYARCPHVNYIFLGDLFIGDIITEIS